MKYYLIAGEASGDLQGSNLVKELRRRDAEADIRCWGGDLMEGAGATLVKHYRDLAFMGFVEVLMNLRTILRNLDFCKQDITAFAPDVLVLIDYPGFNLRVAEWAKQQGIRVVYYISPQVWAWKESRVKKIRQVVDKMLVILPFEKGWYRDRWQFNVEFVGHPLTQVVNEFLEGFRPEVEYLKPVIALLPGSRKQEVAVKLPVMLEAAKAFPDYQFVVAKAASLDEAFYQDLLKAYPGVLSVHNETYALLAQATAALVTSGTATLETALFGVPQVVCYKGSNISYQIAKRLVRIKYISLVNLIMDKPVVTELIQGECNPANVKRELGAILNDPARLAQIKDDYYELKQLLQQGGNASAKAAEAVLEVAKGKER
ncbi:lipid-A-disaccharide synthase [Flaviaesturariibacter flavus]|uniref:Lipid-A-disaccharide synthase n=1 Tax=Flaviaesturariibacter flavus TaxID=2502780 RepID=A0A4R1BKH2_9BACT|nr:lipid-A-disaccharide synthase [Flaviaesturariibacter flavus]TCJ17777.1 lipid-A-disaccharide synthase [Flaviaesturariibacter flavus]